MGWKGNHWEDRSKTEVRGKRVRGMAGVVRAGQGACVVGCCKGDSNPHTQDRRMRLPKSLKEPVGHPPGGGPQHLILGYKKRNARIESHHMSSIIKDLAIKNYK